MFYKSLQKDTPLQLSALSVLHLFSTISFFVPVMHQRRAIVNEWGFIALLEILTNNQSTLQSRLATAGWLKQLHRYYNVACHSTRRRACLVAVAILTASLSRHVSKVRIILVKRLSPALFTDDYSFSDFRQLLSATRTPLIHQGTYQCSFFSSSLLLSPLPIPSPGLLHWVLCLL